jgi:hypothetical protein
MLKHNNNSSQKYENYYAEDAMSSVSLIANSGFKFIPKPGFAIFTLANFGYAVYNSSDFSFKNNYMYGVNVLGTYELIKSFSIGASLAYNRHSAMVSNNSFYFNEYSANINAAYSL